jgi:hypothetical protein
MILFRRVILGVVDGAIKVLEATPLEEDYDDLMHF